jgi:hypothetical protein
METQSKTFLHLRLEEGDSSIHLEIQTVSFGLGEALLDNDCSIIGNVVAVGIPSRNGSSGWVLDALIVRNNEKELEVDPAISQIDGLAQSHVHRQMCIASTSNEAPGQYTERTASLSLT